MSIPSGAQRAPGHPHLRHGGWAFLFVFFVAIAAVVGSTRAPTRTPTPTPAPEPAPTPTPTPAPTLGTIAVPASIDATGATNVLTALTNFFATVPDGSAVVFKAGGIYRVEPGLRLYNRKNLVLEGNGATIKNVGYERSTLGLWGGDHITVRNLTLLGDNPDVGMANAYHSYAESSANILLYGVSNVEIANVTMSGSWGDCLYVATYGSVWSDTVSLHDSTCKLNGRMGVAVIAAKNVTVERVHFDQIAMYVLDIEPNLSNEGAINTQLINNTVERGCLFVSANGLAGTTVSGLTISGNTVAGTRSGYSGQPTVGQACGLNTDVSVSRRSGVVFTNNTNTTAVPGPVLNFAHVDGLTVTGNVQPLTSGVFASITDSTGVTHS